MTNKDLISLFNGGLVRRYSALGLAQQAAAHQRYPHVIILLGCDDRFWVPATPRVAARLMKAGYEVAEVF